MSARAPRNKTDSEYSQRNSGQKAWLLSALLLLFVLPLLGGTYWMYRQSREEIAKAELQNDLLKARTLSAIVEKDFTSAENILTSIAERSVLQTAWARRDLGLVREHLQEARKLEPAFLFASVYQTDGTLRAIMPADKIVGENFANRDWYRGVSARWQPYVSEVYRTAAGSNPPVVAVAVPIRDSLGKPAGILMATYSLSQLAQNFTVLEKGATDTSYVLDQHGNVVASPESKSHGEPLLVPPSSAAAHALAGIEGSDRLRMGRQDVFVGYAPVSRLGWAVLCVRPESAALAPAFHLKGQNRSVSLYLLLVYLATAALAALLMRRQTQLLSANQVLNLKLESRIIESRRAREELDRYFTLALDMFCIAGADGYFKRLNPAWQKTLGFTREELMAKPYLDFIHPDDRERTIRQAEMQGQGQEVILFQNRYRCKDGSYKWLSWTATPLIEQKMIYAVARDVTEFKQVQEALVLAKEEAERSNKFKDQFLSTMSHELRTPLNAVVGFSDLLCGQHYGTLNDRQKRYVDHIKKGGKHLLRLINDILDLSKIEAGRLELSIETVSVRTAIADVLDTMRPLADKKSQKLVQHVLPDLSVRADLTRFKQILMNLLGNAIKFTPEQASIELSVRQLGEVARMEVRDTGPGIPPEEQQRIFEGFYRLRQNEQGAEGTGLGLAITRRLVELQGGHLGIESEPGAGSCFFFTLPIVPTLQKEEHSIGGFKPSPGGTPRILVVEDDPTAAHLLESQLTSVGYDVVVCNDPERAVKEAADLQPRAVTLDVVMKPIGGWEVLAMLKSNRRTASIPVIVVTIVDAPATGALLGADEYIVKPVEKSALLSALERCLNRRGRSGRGGRILVVEDHAPTREFIAELLSNRGYVIATASDATQARSQIAVFLPELVILDLILPDTSGFELLAEWRSDRRTREIPTFILTSKDLTPEEREYLRANSSALFLKQEPWQEALIRQLHRTVLPVLIGQT